MKRFVLEGTWRGYSSSQDHVCHREVCNEKKAKWAQAQHSLPFSDGTALMLTARPAAFREKITTKFGYGRFINDHYYQSAVFAKPAKEQPCAAAASQ